MIKTDLTNESRDRVFFRYVNDIKDIWRDGYGNEVGEYFESLGNWYRLWETRIEEEGGLFLFTALFRYKGTQAEPGVEPQPTGTDLGEFVRRMELREFAPGSSWMRANQIRMASEVMVYPV